MEHQLELGPEKEILDEYRQSRGKPRKGSAGAINEESWGRYEEKFLELITQRKRGEKIGEAWIRPVFPVARPRLSTATGGSWRSTCRSTGVILRSSTSYSWVERTNLARDDQCVRRRARRSMSPLP